MLLPVKELVKELTREHFVNSGWLSVIEPATVKDCSHYQLLFAKKYEEMDANGNESQANLFMLLSYLSSMWLHVTDIASPLKHGQFGEWSTGGVRGLSLSDFEPSLDYLNTILHDINDPELQARIADVLWLGKKNDMGKRDYKFGQIAITAYLQSSKILEDYSWYDALDRLTRASSLALTLKHPAMLNKAYQQIDEWLNRFDVAEPTSFPARLIRLSHEIELSRKIEKSEPDRYTAHAESFALSAEKHGEWNFARDYWNIKVKIATDETMKASARLRSAETYVSEAESRLGAPHGEGYMVAAKFLSSAIEALRLIEGQGERITELHHRLLQYQQLAVSEMLTTRYEGMPDSERQKASETVAGKSLYNAIFTFARLVSPPNTSGLRKQALWNLHNNIFTSISTGIVINSEGRTIAQSKPFGFDTKDDEAIQIEMYQVANRHQHAITEGLILPAREQLLMEHTISVEDLIEIFVNNAFVPRGREEFFAHGLQAGFRGDFAVAVHLLVPQIENSVRHILNRRGVITSKLEDGIQEERTLGLLLRPDKSDTSGHADRFVKELEKALGEDVVFDLRRLLIERHGANLRNNTAHGYSDYRAFYTLPCVYLWWLTLHLCCRHIILAANDQAQDDSASEEQTDLL